VLDGEWSGRPSELNDKKLMDISDPMLRVHDRINASGHHFQQFL
jgi:hypothetical protein